MNENRRSYQWLLFLGVKVTNIYKFVVVFELFPTTNNILSTQSLFPCAHHRYFVIFNVEYRYVRNLWWSWLKNKISESWLRILDDVRTVARRLLRSTGGRHIDEATLRDDDARLCRRKNDARSSRTRVGLVRHRLLPARVHREAVQGSWAAGPHSVLDHVLQRQARRLASRSCRRNESVQAGRSGICLYYFFR